jgi:hypothetical protein
MTIDYDIYPFLCFSPRFPDLLWLDLSSMTYCQRNKPERTERTAMPHGICNIAALSGVSPPLDSSYTLNLSGPPQTCDELPSHEFLHSSSSSFVERLER